MDNNLNETEINVSQNSVVQVDITNDSSVDVGVSAERSVIRGVDGFSPIAKVTQESDGARITITDINGTTTAIAKNGERGERGIQGERGERGEQGIQGIQGERGERGEQGIQGIQGERGERGEQGIQGERGERGEQGIQGERGERGEQGIQGIQGERGERGEQGIQGVAGADGFSPIATVNKSGGTATITITDKNGTTTASVTEPTKTSELANDGADGTSAYVETNELASVATSGSYNDLSDKPTIMTGLTEMFYGEANAWAKFIAAYQAKQIVYCRASGGTNPASGSQTRKAFMAYVNNADSPTSVEFQYVRSVSSKTASQPVDQVFVYTLTNVNGGTWTAVTRNMAPKVVAGTNTTVSYSNGAYTISATQPTVPTKTSELTNDSGFITSAPKLVDLSGQIQTEAFHRSVIALCRVSTTANTELNSWSSGRIVLHRNNGLVGVADIIVDMENQYSGAYYTNVSYLANIGVIASNGNINTATGFRPCTFKYNDVYYGGIELYISAVNLQNAFFTGVGNFDVFGLDYYSTNTSSALNAEVFNSINFTQFSKTTNTWIS